MPFNGSGTFNPLTPPTFPAVAGTVISATYFNAIINDLISNGLNIAWTRDGQAAASANISMGSNRLTNLANAVNPQDAVSFGQISALIAGATAGNLTVNGTLTVTTTSTFTGAATFGNNVTINGTLTVVGATALSSVTISGAAVFSGAVSMTDPKITLAINAQTGTSYTFVLADHGKLVTFGNVAAITVTIPANASVAFPIGATITIAQQGAGQVTVNPGGGVALSVTPGNKLRADGSGATLIKTAINTWLMGGDLSA
jgi:hypothetical protein